MANGKNLQLKKFNYFVWTPLRSKKHTIATGINNTSGAGGKISTGGKFATGVVDTGGKV
jgi:hypothetical protein